MTPILEVAALCVALTAVAAFVRGLYRRIRDFVHFHDKLDKHLSPNGNKPLTEGGTFFDALRRIEGKVDLLHVETSDVQYALSVHVSTSDAERAALRQAVRELNARMDAAEG